MTTATVNVRALKLKIKRLIEAEIEHSWMGSKHPDYFRMIFDEVEAARADLKRYLKSKEVK